MSSILRIELLVVALLGLFFVVRSINKNRFSLKNSLGWFFLTCGMVLFALFPKIPNWCATSLGFETTANFIYTCGLFYLLFHTILSNIITSRQEEQIKVLVQEISIIKSKGKDGK